MQIEKGIIEEVPVENLFLKADIRNNEVSITKLSIDAFDGHATISGKINIDSTGITGILMNAGLSFNHLNIEDLASKFKQDNPKGPGKQVLVYPEKLDLTVDLKAAEIEYKDISFTNLKSNIKATDRQIQLNGFYTDLPFGNLTMDINVNDYINDKIKYIGSANLSIDSLELDRFLELQAFGIPGSGNSRSAKENSQNEKTLPGLPQNIDLNLNVDAGYLSYKNATVTNLDMEIDYRDKRIDLDHLKFGFAGGTTDVHGYILKDQPDSYPGYLYSKVDSIEISGFFQSFDNFNQNVFTSQNSSGKISWASHYYFEMNKDLSLDEDGNLIILNTRISDAEFNQVEPIVKTLFFVGHKSKDKMIVKDLNVNAFLFKNKIYFTDVLMNDNIANLDVYGEVDLGENKLDVGIEISLSDLFFRSKKTRMLQTEAGEIDIEND